MSPMGSLNMNYVFTWSELIIICGGGLRVSNHCMRGLLTPSLMSTSTLFSSAICFPEV